MKAAASQRHRQSIDNHAGSSGSVQLVPGNQCPLTDAEHEELDKDIFDEYADATDFSDQTMALILDDIMGDDRLKRLSVREAKRLLKKYPALKQELMNGFNTKSFKRVRQLGIFDSLFHLSSLLTKSFCRNSLAGF